MSTMTKTFTTKAALGLMAAATISTSVPTNVEAAPYGRRYAGPPQRHHAAPPPRQHSRGNGGAVLGLALGALAIGAIIANETRAHPPVAYHAPVYVEPPAPYGIPFAPPPGTLFYCPGPNDYYPNVTSCHLGWQLVTPPPPPQGSPG